MRKFALIGCGAVARLHVERMDSQGKLLAVCDILPERSSSFASLTGASSYSSLEALLENEPDVDTVCVCTPTGLHAEHSIKILQARKNVLCESPLCLTTAGAWQIMETEKYCGRRLAVASSIQNNPANKELKAELERNKQGAVKKFHLSATISRPKDFFKGWRGKTFPAGGMLYTELARYLDLVIFLFGRITSVTGSMANMSHPEMEVEDWGSAVIETELGITGLIEWSVNRPGEQPGNIFAIQYENGKAQLGEEHFHQDYKYIYENLEWSLKPGNPSQAFEAWKTVEAIEKIYKAASLNHPD